MKFNTKVTIVNDEWTLYGNVYTLSIIRNNMPLYVINTALIKRLEVCDLDTVRETGKLKIIDGRAVIPGTDGWIIPGTFSMGDLKKLINALTD